MAFVIVTDSASDMPMPIKEKYDIHVIPTPVTIEGTDYFDSENIFPDEFYQIQSEGKDIKTYHISQYMFVQHFSPYAERGDEVLYICFSTGIAGTYNAANLARDEIKETYPNFTMTIIDSKSASCGISLIVERLFIMKENGAPKDVIIKAAEFYSSNHVEHLISVVDLEYLIKGGRVSRFSGVMGGALDIKPIIVVNKDGALEPKEKVRGFRKAVSRLIDMVGERGVELEKQRVAVCAGTDKFLGHDIAKRLVERYNVKSVMIGQVGCAIGAHTGPGVVGIVFLNASESEFAEYLKFE
ncbi:MAG: DegV family protein [Lachnospiraceae bacterium]|nr:DegV family protein [Lachnospiraceae bacterium]